MHDYRLETTVSGGTIRLEHLPFPEGERVEVTVSRKRRRAKGWPRGYFEATFGAIKDEGFVRHPQGEYEGRESLR